jgi:hypothetical protein
VKIATHELTIDPARCHGLENCRACERIMPGLVNHCRHYGRLLLGEWALRENSAKLSALAVACEPRAIMWRPVDSHL